MRTLKTLLLLLVGALASAQPTITTSTLSKGGVGLPIYDTLKSTGGSGPVRWHLRGYKSILPTGLYLIPNGVINGYPVDTVTKTFTVEARDSAGVPAYATLTLADTSSTAGGSPALNSNDSLRFQMAYGGTSISQSYTVHSGTHLVMLLLMSCPTNDSITTVPTYGSAMTKLAGVVGGNSNHLQIFYLINPTPGTANITGTLTASQVFNFYVITYNNANQSTPFGALVAGTTYGTGVNSLTVASSSSNDLILNLAGWQANNSAGASNGTILAQSSQGTGYGSWLWSTNPGTGSNVTATANSVTDANSYFIHAGVALKP